MMIILWSWLAVVAMMFAMWLYYRITNNPGIVDVGWSLGHWLAGTMLLFAVDTNQRTLIIWLALTLWTLRLAGYLFWTRIRVGEVDKRYQNMSDHWKMAPSMGFLLNFQFQGALLMVTVCSLYFTGQHTATKMLMLDWFALVLVIVGITMETIADLQLHSFVKNNQGKVCNIGLWQYSRHPNYFFEWMVWVGFSLTALSTAYGWIGLISPISLFLIMNKVTGPITERGSIQSKGQLYKDYQARTSMFFPMPPKKDS